MVYAMWANAFRGGGANTSLAARVVEYEDLAARGVPGAQQNLDAAEDLLTFEGDDVSSLEVGIKSTVLNGRLDFTLAAYQMTTENAVVPIQSNFQELDDPDNPLRVVAAYPVRVNDNVGAAESAGVELELRGQLTESLSVRAGGSWIPNAEVLTQQVGGTIAGRRYRRQHRIGQPYSPDAGIGLFRHPAV